MRGWFVPAVLAVTLFIVLVTILLTAGCTSGAGAPVVIDSTGDPDWIPYTNNDLHISVKRPVDWEIASVSKATLEQKTTMDLSRAMDRFVFVCAPNMTGCVMIFGVDYSGEPGSGSRGENTWISDERYHELLANAKSSTFEGIDVTITAIGTDSRNYLINGNPARHASFTLEINGDTQTADCYIIARDEVDYLVWYAARPGSTISNSETASAVMRTFDIAE